MGVACPKPELIKRTKRRKERHRSLQVKAVRAHVFERERGMCRCCGWREAESMHELKFRSQGGRVCPENSVAVCGDGVRGCHGFLQRHEIRYRFDKHRSAEYWIAFRMKTQAASDYVGVFLNCERPSDAKYLSEDRPDTRPRTPIERLIDDACGREL